MNSHPNRYPVASLFLAGALLALTIGAGLYLQPGHGPSLAPASSPTPAAVTVLPPTALPPTPLPTPTPTSTPTPEPAPRLSAPVVSGHGVVYAEDDQLLFVANDGQQRTLAQASGVRPLAWSPDETQLLYVAFEGEPQEKLYLLDWATGQPRDLTVEFPELMAQVDGLAPDPWSPDGTRLLFFSTSTTNPVDSYLLVGFWLLDLPSGAFWPLVADGPHVDAVWVDDATVLVDGECAVPELACIGRVLLAAPSQPPTTTIQAVTLPPPYYAAAGTAEPPTHTVALQRATPWVVGEQWVAYGAYPAAGGGLPTTVLVDTSDVSATRVISGLLPLGVSPDGQLLASASCDAAVCRLAVLDVHSAQITPITPAGDARLWDLAWSPQGTYLAYSIGGAQADLAGLVLWERATGERRLLRSADENAVLTDLLWSADGCTLYAAQRDATVEEMPVSAVWSVGADWSIRQVAPAAAVDGTAPPCPASSLAGQRLIAFYGTPLGPGLGILGRTDVTTTLSQLSTQIAAYQELDPETSYLPAFHMVTTIADAYPGDDEDYNHRVDHSRIQQWIDAVRAAGGWAIVDVQPAHADLMLELALLEPLLRQPDVHLAVDPEFLMAHAEDVPGAQLGQISGQQLNQVQAWLEGIARASGQQKLLIIHQFDDRMIVDKDRLLNYAFVDLVWDSDGFGSPGPKIGDYHQYSRETGFQYGGFKIFYDYDTPVMTPGEVLQLSPVPVLVIYQ